MDLAQLETSTPMEVFVHVRQHLIKQNAKSLGHDGGCAYRGNHDRCCGAGCVFSNEDYDRLNTQVVERGLAKKRYPENCGKGTIEGMSWSDLYLTGLVTKTHASLMLGLQKVHDFVEVYQWPLALSVVEANVRAGDYDVEEGGIDSG